VVTEKAHPTGAELAAGLSRLVPHEGAPLVHVGPSAINATLRKLQGGGRIDLTGASGSLDVDLDTGDALSDILLWCPQFSKDQRLILGNNGELYDVARHQVTGDPTVGPCGYQ
jgi:hypothetical protein